MAVSTVIPEQDGTPLPEISGPPKRTFITLTFRYNSEYILPYEDGLAVMKAMEKAEQFSGYSYDSDKAAILPIESDPPTIKTMSDKVYCEIKMRNLLNPPISD